MYLKLIINLIVQFVIVFVLVTILIDQMGYPDEGVPFIIGNALASVLLPYLFNLIIAGLYKLLVKKKYPIFYLTLWIFWGILTFMSIHGNMLSGNN